MQKRSDLEVDRRVVTLVPSYGPQGQELEDYIHRLRTEKGFARVYVYQSTGKIVAGYEKYTLCKQHGIPFETIYLDFESQEELDRWVVNYHLQQTNLSKWTRATLAVKHFKAYYEQQAKENQRLSQGRGKKGSKVSANLTCKIDTAERLAQKAGVSRDIITKVNYLYDNQDCAPAELFAKLESEEITVSNAYTIVRRFVSIDLSQTFCAEAKQRIQDEMNKNENNTKAA